MLNPGIITDSLEGVIDNGVSAGGCSGGSHRDSCDAVISVSGSDDGTTGPG